MGIRTIRVMPPFAAGLAVVLCLAACKGNDNPALGGGGIGQTQEVTLVATNGGQNGTAVLAESPSLVLSVTIKLSAPASGAPAALEPAAIRAGTCTHPDASARFALSGVVNSQSTTKSLNTTLGELQSSPYVIVIQRSAQDPAIVSCGAIPTILATP
ncbi:MAG: hypothetical protein NVSMB32_14480 [Actinomycetota bacterium]